MPFFSVIPQFSSCLSCSPIKASNIIILTKPLNKLLQTIYFLPYVTNSIAIGMVFAMMFNIIGLRNNNGININTSCEVGDIIRLNAKVVESTNETEKGKLYLTLVEGLQIVSSNNAISYDLTNAVSVSNQDELAAFVLNGKDNSYKLVKL